MYKTVYFITKSAERTEQILSDRLDLSNHDCYQHAANYFKMRCFNWHDPQVGRLETRGHFRHWVCSVPLSLVKHRGCSWTRYAELEARFFPVLALLPGKMRGTTHFVPLHLASSVESPLPLRTLACPRTWSSWVEEASGCLC